MIAPHLAALALLAVGASGALAEPMALSAQELDRVTAGGSVQIRIAVSGSVLFSPVQIGEPGSVLFADEARFALFFEDRNTRGFSQALVFQDFQTLLDQDFQTLLDRLLEGLREGDRAVVVASDGAQAAAVVGPGRAASVAVAASDDGPVSASATALSGFDRFAR